MKKVAILLAVIGCVSLTVVGQDKKWVTWDKKQVDKMLNDSPWGQTQMETDTSSMTYQPTADPRTSGSASSRDESTLREGAKNSAMDLKFRIRMFSARPIREALARTILLANPNIKAEQLNGFLNGDYSDSIVVAVVPESTDRRYLGPVNQKLASATTETLKNSVFLERGDGKRLFLEEYAAPTNDGTGAKFVFAKLVEGGSPWMAPDDTFRFVADLGGGTKVVWKFRLADMKYNGILEY